MEVITRSGRGGNAPTSCERRLVADDQVIKEEEIPNNVVQGNEEVRIYIDDSVKEIQEGVNPSREHIIDILEPVVQKANTPLPKPPPLYHQRLAKQNGENQFKKFIQMIKSLSINVPLVEALEQIPGYAKFMKDLVTKKRLMNFENIKVTHQVSGIVHSMAPKFENTGAFTIPCTIGSAEFAKAVCDLGASINLMPYSIFKTLGIGKQRPTSMRFQIVDRTMKRPLGRIGDILVRVDKFILPADFVILDCEVGYAVPIILVRPFLATGKALCNVDAGELTFRVGDEKEWGLYNYVPRKLSLDLENRKTPPTKHFTEEPPTLVLKPLPSHIRYEFLGPCSTLPVILSSCLTDVWVDSILIKLDDGAKSSIEHQRRLNEAMQEVVKKEIIKWLDVGLSTPSPIVHGPLRFNVSQRRRNGEDTIWFVQCTNDFSTVYDGFFHGHGRGLLEVFMDDFSVVGDSFDDCLANLDKVFARCEETNLVLNWEKCHFMVGEGIILGRKISRKGIEVDKAKIEDEVIRRCVPEEEQGDILGACHSSPYGGYHGGAITAAKELSCDFYWPTLYNDASDLVKRCNECQRADGISKKNEMPLTTILDIDIFDVWGIDFMDHFGSSCRNTYILVAVDYVSKRVLAIALPTMRREV
ncbi:uncharacterized protein [Nicotiana sylvestris]|uniref:uncharacterized protein n=1 Tax=Nicotiana sylvestris TaxID=4096 RepID=UPI00388C3A85